MFLVNVLGRIEERAIPENLWFRRTSLCASLFYSSSHAILDNVGGDDDMERPSLSLDPDPSYLIRFYTYLSVTLLLKEGGYPIPSPPPPPFYVPIHVTYLRSLRASKSEREEKALADSNPDGGRGFANFDKEINVLLLSN